MKQLLTAILGAGLLWAGAAQADIMVEGPWVREAPPNAPALAGYMVLHNSGETDRALVGAACDAFGNVMLHRTVMEDGMAKMIHQPQVTIPAGGKEVFEPGGYHIMLMKPKQPLTAGDEVEVTLEFANGDRQVVTFPVKSGGMGMDMGGHHHGGM